MKKCRIDVNGFTPCEKLGVFFIRYLSQSAGSSKFEYPLVESGFKFCPYCKTNIQRKTK